VRSRQEEFTTGRTRRKQAKGNPFHRGERRERGGRKRETLSPQRTQRGKRRSVDLRAARPSFHAIKGSNRTRRWMVKGCVHPTCFEGPPATPLFSDSIPSVGNAASPLLPTLRDCQGNPEAIPQRPKPNGTRRAQRAPIGRRLLYPADRGACAPKGYPRHGEGKARAQESAPTTTNGYCRRPLPRPMGWPPTTVNRFGRRPLPRPRVGRPAVRRRFARALAVGRSA